MQKPLYRLSVYLCTISLQNKQTLSSCFFSGKALLAKYGRTGNAKEIVEDLNWRTASLDVGSSPPKRLRRPNAILQILQTKKAAAAAAAAAGIVGAAAAHDNDGAAIL